MIMPVNRRRHERQSCQALITYSEYEKTHFCDAVMHDVSVEGIGFGSDKDIESREPFSIIIPPRAPIVLASSVPTVYVARLRWRRMIKEGLRSRFTMGAQLIFKGYVLHWDEVCNATGRCDLCGARLCNQVYKTDEPLFLCLNCFRYLGGRLKDHCRDSVMRFALGNVI